MHSREVYSFRKETAMKGDHLVAVGIGILIGWLVLPMVLNLFMKKGS